MQKPDEIDSEFFDIHPDTIPSRPFIHKRFLEMATKAGVEAPILCVGKCKLPMMMLVNNRVLISDSMLALFNDREAVAFLAHELVHQKQGLKAFILGCGPYIGAMSGAIPAYMLGRRMRRQGENMSRRQALAALGTIAVSPFVGLQLGKVAITISENEADDGALILSGDKEALISAMQKMDAWCKDHQISDSASFYSLAWNGRLSWNERIERISDTLER